MQCTGEELIQENNYFNTDGNYMSKLSSFEGINIYMYPYDNKQHNIKHIHAYFSEYSMVFSIEKEAFLEEGSMPNNKRNLIKK